MPRIRPGCFTPCSRIRMEMSWLPSVQRVQIDSRWGEHTNTASRLSRVLYIYYYYYFFFHYCRTKFCFAANAIRLFIATVWIQFRLLFRKCATGCAKNVALTNLLRRHRLRIAHRMKAKFLWLPLHHHHSSSDNLSPWVGFRNSFHPRQTVWVHGCSVLVNWNLRDRLSNGMPYHHLIQAFPTLLSGHPMKFRATLTIWDSKSKLLSFVKT